jgi:hypothetical protein
MARPVLVTANGEDGWIHVDQLLAIALLWCSRGSESPTVTVGVVIGKQSLRRWAGGHCLEGAVDGGGRASYELIWNKAGPSRSRGPDRVDGWSKGRSVVEVATAFGLRLAAA